MHSFVSKAIIKLTENCRFTEHRFTPAGANKHPLAGGRVGDGSIVMDECGVEGHAINVQGHRGELDTERKMMPLAVTHLLGKDNIASIWTETKVTAEEMCRGLTSGWLLVCEYQTRKFLMFYTRKKKRNKNMKIFCYN